MKEKGVPLHVKILVGLLLGGVAGLAARALLGGDDPGLKGFIDYVAKPAGDVFLALLFMIVVPLIFSALVMGMQELGQAKKFGRVGGYSLLLTVGLSLIACTIALVGVNLIQPGRALPPDRREALIAKYEDKEKGAKALETAKRPPRIPPSWASSRRIPSKNLTARLTVGSCR